MKIAILGYAGSGKTFLSDYLSEKKNIPVLHLDEIKWNKEWKPIENSIILPVVFDFMKKESWIIDGYYDYLYYDERLKQADLIVLLLLPRLTCFFQALKRTKSRRKTDIKTILIGGLLNLFCSDAEAKKDGRLMPKSLKNIRIKRLFLKQNGR